MTTSSDTLGERIRAALGDKTQTDLASALGVKQPQLSRLMSRETYDQRARAMRAVAVALGVDVGFCIRTLHKHGDGDDAQLARQLVEIAEVLGVDVAGLVPGQNGP